MTSSLEKIKASARKLLDDKPFSINDLVCDEDGNSVTTPMDVWLEKVKIELDKLEAIEIVLHLHYVEGDMTEKEALDEICHLVHPESRPSSEVKSA